MYNNKKKCIKIILCSQTRLSSLLEWEMTVSELLSGLLCLLLALGVSVCAAGVSTLVSAVDPFLLYNSSYPTNNPTWFVSPFFLSSHETNNLETDLSSLFLYHDTTIQVH